MNLMIVEDEPPILRDIKYTIESFKEDYVIYATATDGKTAMELLEKNAIQIDVLITDIQIPLVDGLELITYVKTNLPHIYCIIISGFSEFSYAKRAVKLGVSDYLLKPINEEELHSLLDQIYIKWCYNFLLDNHPVKLRPFDTNKATFLPCLVVIMESFFMTDNETNTTCEQPSLQQRLELLLLSQPLVHKYVIASGLSTHQKTLLLIMKKENAQEDLIKKILKPLLSFPFTIVVGNPLSAASYTKAYLNQMHSFLEEHMVLEQPQLLFYEDDNSFINYDILFPSDDLLRLQKLFHELNANLFQAELQQLVHKMQRLQLPLMLITRQMHTLVDRCLIPFSSISNMDSLVDAQTINHCVLSSRNYEQLNQQLSFLFHQLLDSLLLKSPLSDDKQNRLCHINNYINQHCFEPINTKSIAKHFGFTPAYLSKIYQEYKHMSPMDYILKLRMEKAKELLYNNPELVIKDVSSFVGYPDSLYFSKVFKKYTGLSPKDYSKSIKKD